MISSYIIVYMASTLSQHNINSLCFLITNLVFRIMIINTVIVFETISLMQINHSHSH